MINEQPRHKLRVGTSINLELPRDFEDVFAYSASDMQGLDLSFACHELNIKEGFRPFKKKLKHQGLERTVAAAIEIKKLLEARIIKYCQYMEWLANVVPVKKENGT